MGCSSSKSPDTQPKKPPEQTEEVVAEVKDDNGAAPKAQKNETVITCRSCNNTGIDVIMGNPCSCELGKQEDVSRGVATNAQELDEPTGSCRSCSNTGLDNFGNPCSCQLGSEKKRVKNAERKEAEKKDKEDVKKDKKDKEDNKEEKKDKKDKKEANPVAEIDLDPCPEVPKGGPGFSEALEAKLAWDEKHGITAFAAYKGDLDLPNTWCIASFPAALGQGIWHTLVAQGNMNCCCVWTGNNNSPMSEWFTPWKENLRMAISGEIPGKPYKDPKKLIVVVRDGRKLGAGQQIEIDYMNENNIEYRVWEPGPYAGHWQIFMVSILGFKFEENTKIEQLPSSNMKN